MSETNPHHQDHIFKGIFFSLIAFFLFAVMSAAAKLLTDTHSVFEISFYRSLIALLPLAAYIFFKKRYDLLKVRKPITLFFRILIGISGLLFTFGAMKHMPMADATLILLTATLITPILAFFFLSERNDLHRWSAIIIGLIGVTFIVQPTGQAQLIGTILAFLGAFTHATAHIMLRLLKGEPVLTITFYFLLGSTLLMAPFMLFVAHAPENWQEIVLLLTVGLSGLIAQLCLAYALKIAPASSIAPFNFSSLLWATGFDILIWSYIPGWPVFLGGGIILSAKLYIIHREHIDAKQP